MPYSEGSADPLGREILAAAGFPATGDRVARSRTYLRDISSLDYVGVLLRTFDGAQIRGLLKELRSCFLPDLNRRIFNETRLDRLAATASTFGVDLKTCEFTGATGSGLRGVYIGDPAIRHRPLIIVNGANDPISIGSTVWHELAHHFMFMLFGSGTDHRVNASWRRSNYPDHLTDPRELAADLVMALVAYPNIVARRLYGESERNEIPDLMSKVRTYVQEITGLDVPRSASYRKNLDIVASAIHTAKLRAALLTGFGI